MKFAAYRQDTSVPFAGARTEPVSGDCEESIDRFTGLNAARENSAGTGAE